MEPAPWSRVVDVASLALPPPSGVAFQPVAESRPDAVRRVAAFGSAVPMATVWSSACPTRLSAA